MVGNDEKQVVLAHMVSDAAAVGAAALCHDFDEARFRALLIARCAEVAGFANVARAANDLVEALGPVGSQPELSYGASMLRVADELDSFSHS
ncbi:hypothetical protein QFZ41_000468 [Luteibacter sp. W1I16]|uniref:hypothetical protein n=1 Tax=Luteibacter sp. W1I16 TaxID=3373922 RepID=UPI003D1E7C83